MNTKQFNKSKLAIHLSLAIAANAGVVAIAQAEEAPQAADKVEVIEVKGIRGSLIRSTDLKRSATGVVDAISAEEMGKFPDTNLAESLQRITGVSVSRSNGEGSQITVRGFGPDFNLVTLNGRQMAGTGFTRSFNFENLSSEGVSSLEIMKTARAEAPTGGLGATVNIVTAKPLQNPGEKYSFMAKGIHDSSVEEGDEVTPEIAGIYSNSFADDTVGVSANFSYHRRDFQRQAADIRSWLVNPTLSVDAENIIDNRPLGADGEAAKQFFDPTVGENGEYISAAFFPQEISFSKDDIKRERLNAQLTLQYAPTDDLTFTVDHTISNAITGTNSFSWGIWNGSFGGNGNAYELDENGTAIYYNSAGDDASFTAFRETNEVDSKATGINIAWQATDNLSVSLDAHTSKTTTDNGKDAGLHANARVILGSAAISNKEYFFRDGDVPGFNVNWQNGTQEVNPSEIGSNFSIFTRTPGESEVSQVQLDGKLFTYTDIGLETVKFGAAYTKQTLSGWGGSNNANAPGFNNGTFAEIFPDAMFERVDLGSFLDEFSFGGNGVAPGYTYIFDLDEAFARQSAYLTEEVIGSDVYQIGTFDGFPVNRVEEETISIYLSSSWVFELSDYDVFVNLGLRYEETDILSPAKSRVAEQVYWAGGSEWLTEFASGGELVEVDYEGEYDLLLPMIDIKVDLTDDLVSRISWGQTITRPTLDDMLGNLSLTPSPKLNSRSGSRGNPNLEPFKSTNFDVSLEYYYSEASYAAIGLFWKDVDNWIDNSQVKTTFDGLHDVYLGQRWNDAVAAIEGRGEQATDAAIYNEIVANGVGIGENNRILPDPATDPLIEWTINSPENVGSRKVNGIEFAIQHLFGESGFGAGLNATMVDGDVEYDNYMLASQAVLAGLSDSANLQLFYEKDGLSVKLTGAWRDKYLIAQGLPDAGGSAPPQYAQAYLQWDVSVNYEVNESTTLFFEGVNLTNETERSFSRFESQFLNAAQYAPRYAVGFRYTMGD
ncbi:TonB-dependent receptor [Pseudoalteromonas sp. J010]|uniref:TonB-dependent receptor n=1 Tax=Pseudoalteromonas sp. J010 TaxID=998465 RepID=UPI000F649385|nr:TonB-dependent receptor [Pseudoalteromonas sp. J010]RRS09187.1 TonB-dependent receptor [Pseudoalteromonas sp. J010]